MNFAIKIRLFISIAFFIVASSNSYVLLAQCSQNNIVVAKYELRDSNGNPFSITDNYQIGQPVTGELWVNLGGSSTNGYNLLMTYDIYRNGVLTDSQHKDCLFSGIQIVQNVFVRVRDVTWNWGDKFDIKNIFMFWITGNAKAGTTCIENEKNNQNAQCYASPNGFSAVLPLYPNFNFTTACDFTGAVNFTNITTGGNPPYTYNWNFGGTGSSTLENPTFTFAQPGNHNVSLTVTDNINAITTVTKTLFIPDRITINAVTNPSQVNGSTGSINVSVTGGTTPYTYLWTYPNGTTQTTEDLTSLGKGTYSLVATDSRGCTKSAQFTIKEILTADFTYQTALCNTQIQFTNQTSGGEPPFNYTYFWNFDGQGTSTQKDPIFDFSIPGSYTVSLTANDGTTGITHTKTVTVLQNFEIDVTIFPTKKDESSGMIYTNVTGGTAPYSFYWTGPNGFTSTSDDIFNLSDGSYTLTVTDYNGCRQIVTYLMEIASILSADLISFDLYFNNNLTDIIIDWGVSKELNKSIYEIERSNNNAEEFVTIGSILTTLKSSERVKYTFTDKSVPAYINSFYFRIKKTSGTSINYSPVKLIKREKPFSSIHQWQAFPNPSLDEDVYIRILNGNNMASCSVRLRIINSGSFFSTQEIELRSTDIINLNAIFGELPPGLTLVEIHWNSKTEIIKIFRGY